MSQTNNLNEIRANYMKLGAQQGWQCPVCGNVLSPWTTMCPCHGQPNWNTITSTTHTQDDSKPRTLTMSDEIAQHIPNINTYYSETEIEN